MQYMYKYIIHVYAVHVHVYYTCICSTCTCILYIIYMQYTYNGLYRIKSVVLV